MVRKISSDSKLIEKYSVGENEIFQVSIYENLDTEEKHYYAECLSSFRFENFKLFKTILRTIRKVSDKIKLVRLEYIPSLDELIGLYNTQALEILDENKLPKEIKEKIAYIVAIEKAKLLEIFPLLIDKNIDKVSLEGPENRVTVYHRKYGICKTRYVSGLWEIERLKAILELNKEYKDRMLERRIFQLFAPLISEMKR